MTGVAVSAVVVNHGRRALLAACLGSLRAALDALGEPWEVIVVDNGSRDGSVELVRERHPEAELLPMSRNVGFAQGVNEGVARCGGEWVLLLNNDATILPEGIGRLLEAGRSSPGVGSVAAQMRFADRPEVINSAGIEIDRLGVAYDRLLGEPAGRGGLEPVEVFGASGGAALYRSAMLEQLGGFDGTFFAYLEDADLAWRARMSGWRCLYQPAAIVHHHHSATAGHASPFKHFLVGRNRVRLLAKNAHRTHLRRYGPAMVVYDIAYVAFAVVADRTLAPLRGRVRGLREWRSYRRSSDARRPVELSPARGVLAALHRRSAWLGDGGAAQQPPAEGAAQAPGSVPPTSSGGPSR